MVPTGHGEKNDVRFEVFMAVKMSAVAFWVIVAVMSQEYFIFRFDVTLSMKMEVVHSYEALLIT